MSDAVTAIDAGEAVRRVTETWSHGDPRWDALQIIADYYQSLPTPKQLAGESQS